MRVTQNSQVSNRGSDQPATQLDGAEDNANDRPPISGIMDNLSTSPDTDSSETGFMNRTIVGCTEEVKN